jgi:hypothetical protein
MQKLQNNLWAVEGSLPTMAMKRRMCVAKMDDGRLVVHNAIALNDSAMSEFEELGEVGFLLVPSGYHRLDAAVFHKRYPDAKVLCPGGARKKVREVVPIDGTYDDFPNEAGVTVRHLDGMQEKEGVMIIGDSTENSLVFNDAIFNLPHGKGTEGLVIRLLGSSGGPKVTRIARWFLIKDKKALRAHFEKLAGTPELKRIIPAHGDIVEDNAEQVLRQLAGTL